MKLNDLLKLDGPKRLPRRWWLDPLMIVVCALILLAFYLVL